MKLRRTSDVVLGALAAAAAGIGAAALIVVSAPIAVVVLPLVCGVSAGREAWRRVVSGRRARRYERALNARWRRDERDSW